MSDAEQMRIDADLWPERGTLAKIAPFLSREWREYLRIGEDGVQRQYVTFRALPESVYWKAGSALEEPDASGSIHDRVRAFLDDNAIVRAVVNPTTAGALSGLANPIFAAEVARATNEWTITEWLEADSRLLATIVVGPRNAELAAAEIHRLGDHDRVVEVALASPPCLLGDRLLDRIYRAASEHALPVGLHAGGALAGTNPGLTGAGHPTSVFEHQIGWVSAAQPHLTSLITEGVFEKYPTLRVVFSGFGVGWLPSLLWRLDMQYEHAATDRPRKLRRRPSEYVFEHVRFVIGELDLSPEPRDLETLLDLVGGSELVMFGSGPMRDVGLDVSALVPDWRPDSRERLLHDNARQFFPNETLRDGHAT